MIQSIAYDQESAVLSIELKKTKSVDSDFQGNVVVDYDKKGHIMRVNFYDFDLDLFREHRASLKKFAFSTHAPMVVR